MEHAFEVIYISFGVILFVFSVGYIMNTHTHMINLLDKIV